MPSFRNDDADRIVRGVKLAEKMARGSDSEPRNFPSVSSGGRATLAVATGCDYDEVTHSLIVTCSRLYGIDYDYDSEPAEADELVAWAGIDPLVVVDSIVLLHPIAPMRDNTEITMFAQPVLSAERSTLDMPDMTCLTSYTEPCGPQQVTELCIPE